MRVSTALSQQQHTLSQRCCLPRLPCFCQDAERALVLGKLQVFFRLEQNGAGKTEGAAAA